MLALIPTSTARLTPIVAQRAPPDAAARIRTTCAPDARTSLNHQRVPRSHAFLRRSLHRYSDLAPRHLADAQHAQRSSGSGLKRGTCHVVLRVAASTLASARAADPVRPEPPLTQSSQARA
ncbi:hypothetical protein EV715DRAFT_288346 [Schizophyllum commune]